ncbi:hypothetical protein LTR91_002955 [Friedmanniomyces endolithicus]|uniref:Uncharacterized protein n=1 Tax=Friedmanniomyces endolithicus TaxID=329885 RepID=A0AAN6L0C4_9PEZI|nr:hypothetical protein LTR57_004610 [Friedmanniomyces endolithicus]KAK1004119.1 hypothetical protein LTS01_003716 [Friedmanniomyces endolithicus]KAK1009305.1 hypothetical protein LTR91_002955 [Friedmanniomyces endolithicus]KAK1031331.1 hypothetical protein LTS16_018136 [Friedmanniomyces endolithicus]
MDRQSERTSSRQRHMPTDHEQQSKPYDADLTKVPHHQPSTFAFPTLSPDGSVEDLSKPPSRPHPTPPAALSSPGPRSIAAMAERNQTISPAPFSDSQYDMIDDLSEISSDDHETASLASDDGIVTPEEGFDEADAQPEEEGELVESMKETGVESEIKSGEELHQSSRSEAVEVENDTLDSYLQDDLETPTQSTMHSPAQLHRHPAETEDKTGQVSVDHEAPKMSTAFKARKWVTSASIPRWRLPFLILKSIIAVALVSQLPIFTHNPIAEHAFRKHALCSAIQQLANSTEASRSFSIDHLLPLPTATSTDVFGHQVHYAPLQPNHFIVSIPRSGTIMSRKIQSVRVHKATRDIAYNQTRIIDGVYDIAFDPTEAHGTVEMEGVMVHPKSAFTIQHNFGNRLLQRQTYEKARTDISKSVTKDIALASDTARTFGEKLQMELLAGAAATKNVTTQLAVQVTRDLQIFVNAAASMVVKVDHALNKTAYAMSKDLALVSRDVVAFGKSVRKSVSATKQTALALIPTKKMVTSPLKLSHKRATGFRQKLLRRKGVDSPTAITKDISTRMQDFVKALGTPKKWKMMTSKTGSKSLSTVPGKALTTPKKTSGKKTSAPGAAAPQNRKSEMATKQKLAEIKKGMEKISSVEGVLKEKRRTGKDGS